MCYVRDGFHGLEFPQYILQYTFSQHDLHLHVTYIYIYTYIHTYIHTYMDIHVKARTVCMVSAKQAMQSMQYGSHGNVVQCGASLDMKLMNTK